MQRPTRLSVLITAIACASTSVARAEDEDVEATALFEKGRELTKAGRDNDACPMFEKSMKLVPAMGTELNLARCWAAIGRIVDAVRLYKDLQSKLADAHQPQREALVKEGLAAVQNKVAHLNIVYVAVKATVQVDGKTVEIDEAVDVDPGHHKVTGDGAKPVEIDIDVGETKSVTLEALPAPPPKRSGQDIVLLSTAAGAGGAFLLGTITGIVTIRQRNAGRDRCVADAQGALVCDPRGVELLEHARTTSHVTTGFFVISAALATVTGLLYMQSRSSSGSTGEAHVTTPTVWLSPSSAGFAVEHVW